MARNLKQKSKKRIKAVFIILFIISAVLIGLHIIWKVPENKLQPLASLPVPSISQINLTSPLTISPLSTVILGAQTIEPDDIIKYVNIERKKIGSPPLSVSPALKKAAADRARVILQYQNFSHQDPYEGIELLTVLPKNNYYFAYASENIGMGGVSAEDFVGGFMHSTSHRENLLDPNLKESGVAVVTGPYKQYYVNIAVQLFAIPVSHEQYLGYSARDKELYKNLLANLGANLENVNYKLQGNSLNRQYYRSWQNLYREQKQIVKSIYDHMVSGNPFTDVQRNLITLYNRNWKKTIN